MARSCPIQGIFLSDRNLPPERQEHARVKNVLLAVFHRADEFIILPPGRKLGFFIIIGPQHRIHEADSASHDSQRQKQTARRLRQNAQNRKLQIIPCRQKPRQSFPVPFGLHNRHETISYIRVAPVTRKPGENLCRNRPDPVCAVAEPVIHPESEEHVPRSLRIGRNPFDHRPGHPRQRQRIRREGRAFRNLPPLPGNGLSQRRGTYSQNMALRQTDRPAIQTRLEQPVLRYDRNRFPETLVPTQCRTPRARRISPAFE
ncbi:hypothetical protein GLS_c17830 [Gluconobacter oxydans DSM 3504]|uniref:Uncharacterized protein n=1 Tax=Gluconobacter oxydans DSM 3504 TaxID=1288313 RepID=A0A067Z7B6_GLUOY|nr:hypothetical protein GLS_c17830 [Gluconobacter oxydans DSM 3504]